MKRLLYICGFVLLNALGVALTYLCYVGIFASQFTDGPSVLTWVWWGLLLSVWLGSGLFYLVMSAWGWLTGKPKPRKVQRLVTLKPAPPGWREIE